MTNEEKQKAIHALKISAPVMPLTQEEFNDYIQTLNKVMDWLEQEPCEDAISRKAVINQIFYSTDNNGDVVLGSALRERIARLPSVTPQEPRKGHWIMTHDYFTGAYESIDYVKCSCCHDYSLEEGNYCPNCGAKMVEPKESEDDK